MSDHIPFDLGAPTPSDSGKFCFYLFHNIFHEFYCVHIRVADPVLLAELAGQVQWRTTILLFLL